MQKAQTWKETVLLSLVGIFTGVVIGEITLRLARIEGMGKIGDYVDSSPTNFHTSDPQLGWWHKPNSSGLWKDEGEAFIEMNSEGLRDREHTKSKPPNTWRIAVLGDSFTEALQVPVQSTFWSIVEKKLNQCPALKGKNVEVINFGVHGYGTAQQLLVLRQKAWEYSPDLVLLAFFNGNDVINNSRELEYDLYRPFFVKKDDQLILDRSFQLLPPSERNKYSVSWVDHLPGWLVNNSRILQLLKKFDLNQKKAVLSKQFNLLSAQNFQPPTEKKWQDAWEVTEEILTLMNQEVTAKNAKFFVATIGDPVAVLPDPKSRQDYLQKNQIQDLFYPDKRIKNLGERENFPVLMLTPPFQRYAEANQVCLHGFPNALECQGHWNDKGHQLGGDLIADSLCKTLSNSWNLPVSTPQKK